MTSPNTPTRSSISGKARFHDTYEREYATTLKVLRAYPADQSSLKPAERSNSALTLAWTFVVEESLLVKALKGIPMFGGSPKAADSWNGVIEAFEKGHEEVVEQLRDPNNANLKGTVKFMVAPKQMGDVPLSQFLWFILHDQIHHRGQLSVYLRMAGGKLPSIYGPTADEPWM